MRFPLDTIVRLSREMPSMPEERPARLRSLRDADQPGNLYYRLFHAMSMRSGPADVVEIGTFVGSSAAHLGANPAVRVLTIDCNPDASVRVAELGLPNVRAVTADSVAHADKLPRGRWIDLLFVDGNHTFNQAYGEYEAYRPLVKPGGLVFFDDIRLPMSTREMDVFWDHVVDPKAELEGMHHTGIGVCVVDPSVALPLWAEVIGAASRRFK